MMKIVWAWEKKQFCFSPCRTSERHPAFIGCSNTTRILQRVDFNVNLSVCHLRISSGRLKQTIAFPRKEVNMEKQYSKVFSTTYGTAKLFVPKIVVFKQRDLRGCRVCAVVLYDIVWLALINVWHKLSIAEFS